MKKLSLTFILHLTLSVCATYMITLWLEHRSENALYLVFAFVISFLLIWGVTYVLYRFYFLKMKHILRLFVFFNVEFIKANLRLTYTILSVRMPLEPAVVSIPLDVQSDQAISLLANLITLTPGTLSLDVSKDRKYLFVHTLQLDGGSIESFKKNIKEGFEKRIIAVVS